jgi:hypothetical protein
MAQDLLQKVGVYENAGLKAKGKGRTGRAETD